MFKKILFVITTLLSTVVFAEVKFRIDEGGQYIQGALGFGPGGIGLGGDYELGLANDVTWGGMLRFYPENTSASKSKVLHIGAFIRPHWVRGSWDFYTNMGAGITTASDPNRNETMVTPTIGIGTSLALTQSISLSIESLTVYGITTDFYRGPFNTDYMFKMRFRLN
ncbi:MAG: hypothetical protein A4S09_08440 [Proteobacteria bacterium SG_bin7]|nr:MAG: hypothetical protein A4S09_08440 [Proteobacteria bacterium SG_bin7]